MFDSVGVVLKKMVTVSVIAEHHLLENLNKMGVDCCVALL